MVKYAIRIRVYSEPNKDGNMSEYWLKDVKTMSFGGVDCRKVYKKINWAMRARNKVEEHLNNIEPFAEVQVRITN